MAEPLCPECRKKMVAHWTCGHCGFDANRTRSKEKLKVLPYVCSRCPKGTQKVINDVPICGDCFAEGWGRLPDMSLSPPVNTVTHEVGTIPDDMEVTTTTNVPEGEDMVFVPNDFDALKKQYKCPECNVKPFKSKQRLNKHKTKIHGG